jgi:ABC-type polysaccharide/polyol phosphate transport system ATPase subunit
MSDTLIKVDGASKKFCRSLKRSLWYGLKDLGNELLGHRHGGNGNLRTDEFWAVRDVSFELKRGECLGLIGRNGAGKTTLLRILNGLIKPDDGRIELRGRIGALIALGAGFNPILTGRENIYVNAAVLGLTRREIDRKLDEIIAFSELEEFIDSPVQSYSSGMQIRLGFSVATALEPDILLLDEVLAVGDIAFRLKCQRRISDLLKNAAVVFVSHDMPHVARICDRTVVMSHGKVAFSGDTPAGIEAYRELNEGAQSVEEGFVTVHEPVKQFEIDGVPAKVAVGNPLSMSIRIHSAEEVGRVTLRCTLYNMAGAFAADCVVDSLEHGMYLRKGQNDWRVEIASLPLRAARYQLLFSIAGTQGEALAISYRRHEIAVTGGAEGTVADCQLAVKSWTPLNSAPEAQVLRLKN